MVGEAEVGYQIIPTPVSTVKIQFALVTRLLPLSDKAVAKDIDGSIPHSTSSEQGTPPEGILPSFPKTIVSTSIVNTERISDQAMRTTVRWYRTSRSRHARE